MNPLTANAHTATHIHTLTFAWQELLFNTGKLPTQNEGSTGKAAADNNKTSRFVEFHYITLQPVTCHPFNESLRVDVGFTKSGPCSRSEAAKARDQTAKLSKGTKQHQRQPRDA